MIKELLKSYVNNEKLNIEINAKELNLLIDQSLQTLLYPVTNNKLYKKYYVAWVLKQDEFYKIQEEITNIFNKNNINHIYFKGSVLSKIYDDPSVRTRGDIDLYISPNDLDDAKKLLLDNGFIIDKNIIDSMHHYGLIKNDIEVELHFNMLDPDNDKKWIKLFNNPFSLSNKDNANLYKFDDTYHLIYCIMHFAYHLRHGAGIRYLLDFYYMLKKTNIDYNLLYNIINDYNLFKLYSNIINSIRYIFEIDFDKYVKEYDVFFFLNYLLKHGIHGNKNNDTSIQASAHNNKIKFFFKRVFLINRPYRITRYPILGAHFYLYPICLIKHWIYLLTHKLGSFFKFIFGKNKNKELYNKLGI